ncbi:hypothetical protein G6F43_000853 [Rhizopus delemar]|nr:hypothetical protein G6F43_000853 [Rhizopus delemar]
MAAQQAIEQIWKEWDELISKSELSILDVYQITGLYCRLTKAKAQPDRLKQLIKRLVNNKFSSGSSSDTVAAVVPFYALLVDMRYIEKTREYLETLVNQCLTQCATFNNDTKSFGPELQFLLQYLNPKTYQTKHFIDTNHVIDLPQSILQSIAQCTLKSTLCQFDLRNCLVKYVEHITKLQERKTDTQRLSAMILWLTSMTRLTLYPIEHAELTSDSLDMATASIFLWTNTLAVPGIISIVSSTKMIIDSLKKWVLGAVAPFLLYSTNKKTCMEKLDGNGCLFLLGNIIDLWNGSDGDRTELVELVTSFLQYSKTYFSDKQSSSFPHYHPLFKWSKATWGNSLSFTVFDRVIKQIGYLWTRPFMDELFHDIVHFNTSTHSSFKNVFKRSKQPLPNSGGEFALFSVEVESIFSMYSLLIDTFTSHSNKILYKIAFTTNLMPQLWQVMNQFGPTGNMQIYLDASKRNDIEKEPLLQVLKVFCQACSILFLTLDDSDIFKHQKPFSPKDLIQISAFLNSFYFSLIQQPATEFPSAAISFKAARQLLLQIYDLDLHHSFCPPNHWLLVSVMPSKLKAFTSLFQSKKKDANDSAALFLANFNQGGPVPLRILQLMSHTVPFDVRLKIFRDRINLEQPPSFENSHLITVKRGQVLLDGYQQLSSLPTSAWKGKIRVNFINELGMEEAGIDRGGPFKEFITTLISEAFKPNYGLFEATSQNSFYPSPSSAVHGKNHIQLFEFIGKAIGKAVCEGILLDVQFASFLLAKLLGRNVFLEELKELDEDVWKNLIYVKNYEGDVEVLGLTFEVDEDVFGKIESHELKYRGKHVPVVNSNRIEYVYLMADYKLNQRAKNQTNAFIHGFKTVVSESWIRLFSPPELQRVLTGEDKDFDVLDMRKHTVYEDGYFDEHPVIRSFWQIVEQFTFEEKKTLLKFVTGCSKPPLGGFSYLQPPFTIRMVSTELDGPASIRMIKSVLKMNTKSGRLPTSSTCFNLLKLPAYTRKAQLKEKLSYSINSNTGFELS